METVTRQPAGFATAADIAHDERLEVINGQVVSKDEDDPYDAFFWGRSPTLMHGKVHHAIGVALGGYSDGAGIVGPGGWLFCNEVTLELEPGEIYRPDMAGWRIERVPELLESPVRIAPDWICEIVSPAVNRHFGRKLQTYHRSRVSHYWLAHPHPTKPFLQVYRWQENGYVVFPAVGDETVRVEPFDAIEFNVARVLGWSGRGARHEK